ncbi:MAG: tRNA 2-thiouridine(34) synthase MnmA [Planctomycetes bacterium]|nr:tRNA 2-thiouridine(34) synthase MnmA [Planctomycetota bacterium]
MLIVTAMSGGVDSSVAAYLLKKQGHEVIGLFMSSGIETTACTGKKLCCSAEDARDARRTAEKIGIPFYSVDFSLDFDKLIRYFCDEYNAGRTPNPCIICNQELKFGKLLEYANSIGADAIATGHYASVVKINGRFSIKRAKDPLKDQSYVLFSLSQEQLSRTVLPLGGIIKTEIRRIAADANLPVKDKPESQDVCFVPDNDYRTLLERRTPGAAKRGEVRDTAGKLLGYHNGFQFYTIGQRQGLGIALGKPAYVIRIDAASNTVVLGDDKELFKDRLTADKLNWTSINGLKETESIDVLAQIRYHHTAAKATVHYAGPDSVTAVFNEPQRAITPGQAVVFYDNEGVVIGGGWISKNE